MKATWWNDAIKHLSKNDKTLKKIINKHNKGYSSPTTRADLR